MNIKWQPDDDRCLSGECSGCLEAALAQGDGECRNALAEMARAFISSLLGRGASEVVVVALTKYLARF